MATIDATGRIRLDEATLEPVQGWAILVEGAVREDLVFAAKASAEMKRVLDRRYNNCRIIPVVAIGNQIERLAS